MWAKYAHGIPPWYPLTLVPPLSRGIYSSQFQILFLLDPSNSFLKMLKTPPKKCALQAFRSLKICTFLIITMVYNRLVVFPLFKTFMLIFPPKIKKHANF